MSKLKAKIIDHFDGPNWFLSNFYPVEVDFEGECYPTVEHAYQAAKTLDMTKRDDIRLAPKPGTAKFYGRSLPLRPNWEGVKLGIMLGLLQQKFAKDPLRSQLLSTGHALLVEGNYWGDTFWGVYKGEGKNHLGLLLMKVRRELQNG